MSIFKEYDGKMAWDVEYITDPKEIAAIQERVDKSGSARQKAVKAARAYHKDLKATNKAQGKRNR